MREQWKLPDGSITNDADAYITAWQALAEPFERLSGMVHFAFDPGYSFQTPDGKLTIDLPTWFVRRFAETAKESRNV